MHLEAGMFRHGGGIAWQELLIDLFAPICHVNAY